MNRQTCVQLFKRFIFSPFQNRPFTQNQDQLEYIVQEIYNWARSNGVQYVSYFANPVQSQAVQKHTTFLSLKFIRQNLIQSIGSQQLAVQNIWAGQLDGSSIKNGGLRQAQNARTYIIWDHLSELFIRKKLRILYIPGLIISPEGHGIDEKFYFRKCQKIFEEQIKKLLTKFNIKFKSIFFALGIQQQFFVIPKQAKQKRLDIQQTNRAIIGKIPVHVCAQKYYMKSIPSKILQILKEVQEELLQLGVPIKVRHSQRAPNQFQIGCSAENAGISIDHNILTMKIIKQVCQKHGFCAMLHQKPFKSLNGSRKHLNWSISYLDKDQKITNLFQSKKLNQELFALIILMTIKAAQDNAKLYIGSTTVPGNEIRMNQSIVASKTLSFHLGQQVSHLIEGLHRPEHKNIKKSMDILLKDFYPSLTDLNTTSPYAFSQNRFQFRIAGSSQNITFPVTVIMASLTHQIRKVLEKLQKGQSIKEIISEYRQSTRNIRYQGDNYSQQWKLEAQKRGIYNKHKTFVDFIKNSSKAANVLIETQIYSKRQIDARFNIISKDYIDTVLNEKYVIQKIISKNLIPRSYQFISTFPRQLHLKYIQNRMRKFDKLFQQLLKKTEQLQSQNIENIDLDGSYNLRQKIFLLSDIAEKVLDLLPESQSFPQVYQFLNKWQT